MKSYQQLLDELGDVKEALSMKFSQAAKLHTAYLNPYLTWISRFLGFKKRLAKASGSHLFDESGNDYLDFLSGFGALNLGHEHPAVIAALREVENYPNILQSYLNPLAGKCAEYLAKLTSGKLKRVFFSNSGSEACEAAIKLARAATGKKLIVYCAGAYHGKTIGALSVSGREKYKKFFEPLMTQTTSVPYNDLVSLEKVFKLERVAAFIIEPIQGEGGMIVPDEGYLKKVETLCRKHEVLLIVDEVQTGMGRTGKFFCYQHEGVVPDILVLSKSLGGGGMPIGATITTDPLWRKAYGSLEKCLLHSSTFGGNSRACACGIAAIRTILAENLDARAAEVGQRLMDKLKDFQKRYSILREVRGRGLMIGLSLARLKGKSSLVEGGVTLWVARQLFKRHRVITAFTMNNLDVLRIAPPLTVEETDIQRFTDALEDVLSSAEKFERFRLIRKEKG